MFGDIDDILRHVFTRADTCKMHRMDKTARIFIILHEFPQIYIVRYREIQLAKAGPIYLPYKHYTIQITDSLISYSLDLITRTSENSATEPQRIPKCCARVIKSALRPTAKLPELESPIAFNFHRYLSLWTLHSRSETLLCSHTQQWTRSSASTYVLYRLTSST